MISLEVLFTPVEFESLRERNLRDTTCVVFDILRATSSMITALENGASAIVPVAEISEAVAYRLRDNEVMLAGERNGLRIGRELTGGIEFDLANSPREFIRERVEGKTIVMTTTNGTRALRACHGAGTILVGSFLNLRAVATAVQRAGMSKLTVVCSGTNDEASYEDALAAGALCDLLWSGLETAHIADSAQMAREIFLGTGGNLFGAMSRCRNARRLLKIHDLADDVAFCLRTDMTSLVAGLCSDGKVTILP